MSHINIEPMQFPWVPILVTCATAFLIYLIVRWFVEYGLFMWSKVQNATSRPKKKKKLPPRKRRGGEEDEEDEEEDQEEDSE